MYIIFYPTNGVIYDKKKNIKYTDMNTHPHDI